MQRFTAGSTKEIEVVESLPVKIVDFDQYLVNRFIDADAFGKVVFWFICFVYSICFLLYIPTIIVLILEPKWGPLGRYRQFIFGKD